VIPTSALIEPAQKAKVGDDGYKIYIPGVGGMGVLTVSALLAYAAMFDGKLVTFLNQTGLSQKNGAVVSHLIIRDAEVSHALFITKGKTNLFLALDLLEASRPDNLDMISAIPVIGWSYPLLSSSAKRLRSDNFLSTTQQVENAAKNWGKMTSF
jgi:Pyruvate/2-oxoacid:ferredoxin oxidoreductase gamma subunit